MSGPLVSIVTPTLDQGRFIEQTIRSIMAQSYDHFEHIVIDGGSTDETLDILRRYEGRYPMRWLSEPDEGMYDAINKGMRLATGDILAYLNSDDLYFPWTLEVVVEAFRRRPDADLVFGDALGIYDDDHAEELRFQPAVHHHSLLDGGYLIQPAVFWLRQLYQATGDFDTQFKLAGDLDWWLRVGPQRRFVRVDEMLAIERDHSGAKRLAQWDMLMEESARSRSRLDQRGNVARLMRSMAERFRAWLARRVLFLRFAYATRDRGGHRAWAHFLSSNRVRMPAGHALAAQLPWLGVRIARGSVDSGVDWLSDPASRNPPTTDEPRPDA